MVALRQRRCWASALSPCAPGTCLSQAWRSVDIEAVATEERTAGARRLAQITRAGTWPIPRLTAGRAPRPAALPTRAAGVIRRHALLGEALCQHGRTLAAYRHVLLPASLARGGLLHLGRGRVGWGGAAPGPGAPHARATRSAPGRQGCSSPSPARQKSAPASCSAPERGSSEARPPGLPPCFCFPVPSR